jgi:predicted metal-dependent hydrolase
MSETIQLGDIEIKVTRKSIKHAHLSVHPPSGRVTLVAPARTRPEVARAFAISKLGWIREQQARLRSQARETPRNFVERETHYLWGRRHLLTIRYQDTKASVVVDHRRITLTVRPGTNTAKKAEVVHEWHRSLLHNHRAGHIRLNTELVKKPKDLLEYVIVHEMVHLLEPKHGGRFISILDRHFPGWREARGELNELPLTAEKWNGNGAANNQRY